MLGTQELGRLLAGGWLVVVVVVAVSCSLLGSHEQKKKEEEIRDLMAKIKLDSGNSAPISSRKRSNNNVTPFPSYPFSLLSSVGGVKG